MAYILGVDGGNSKTLAVLACDSGEVRGIGRSGNSNHQGVGVAAAMEQVRAAAEGAFAMAGVSPERVDAAFYALAGADLPEDFALLEPALLDLRLANRMALDNDSMAGLRAGTDNPNAVVLIWGAGTNAAARNAAGEQARLPALGRISGDWGGGADLAREAIWLVARAHDGRGRPTVLTDLILPALGAQDPDDMIRKLYFRQIDSPRIISLAPLVFRAAAMGDEVARELVLRAAEEITTTANALLRRLHLEREPADVVLAGSVFRAEGDLLLDTVRERLRESAPLARIVLPDVEPVLGAVFCGMDLLGIPTTDDTRARVREDYGRLSGAGVAEVGSR